MIHRLVVWKENGRDVFNHSYWNVKIIDHGALEVVYGKSMATKDALVRTYAAGQWLCYETIK